MNARGLVGSETKKRIDKALELDLDLPNKNMIYVTSGWAYREDVEISLANSMKNYILHKGISEERILTVEESKDTVGDAIFSRIKFAIPLKWKNIVVVTSDYHTKRAKEIFKFIYGKSCKVSFVECFTSNFNNHSIEIKSLSAFRSTFLGVQEGNINQILSAMRERHPYYKEL